MNERTEADDRKHTTSARRRFDRGGLDAAREQRDDLEALADTDLPAARWAKRLLAVLDAEDANNGGDGQ